MSFTVFICGRRPELKTCPQCQSSVAELFACQFQLRGNKAGQVCGKQMCAKCVVKIANVPLCRPHANLTKKAG